MAGTNKPSDDDSEIAPKPAREMSDISRCRVRRSGIADLVCCCLGSDPSLCVYAVRYGFMTFCVHPQWREILARSERRR